ncbi:MAG: type I DNA topoisomerase [Tannerellaceae bacterium]|jgi:DNA topoisomerase-1|nr:type I DNA topoisomerase [Tannerellaceae bacterium]
MQTNLVIVESPAKAKTIEKFLGKDYKVLSSYGHIRDLSAKGFGIDFEHDYAPDYVIPTEKKKVVTELKNAAKKAGMVWLASDEDREGEAISWHLAEALELKPENTKRIVFHEITKTAILHAIETPRDINIDLVNAQQARRVLDRIVGFELSPVLWKKVRPSLSAGRVQSVAVRLIVDREREINEFVAEAVFRVSAEFILPDGTTLLKAELNRRFKEKSRVIAFLESCKDAHFTIEGITRKPTRKSPAPPFTTSTLQQEAARKLGFSVSQTMSVAQRLYESGHITYMRTDSVNLSDLALGTAKETIEKEYGEKYYKFRRYQTKSKGAQEAHEAIRPTYINRAEIGEGVQENKLYSLIHKRTVASQMADAELERTTITIAIGGNEEEKFTATGEVITFEGFLQVYHESNDDENEKENGNGLLPPVNAGEVLTVKEIAATERFTQRPARYTEASLVRRMEELGIGRPSTYAPTIQTIQNREYVIRGDREGTERSFETITLAKGVIKEKTKSETVGSDRNKLLPTDIGIVVNDFLMENFPDILEYNFTANVEKDFDAIAEGRLVWTKAIDDFYKFFHPQVEEVKASRTVTGHKVGARELGNDPKSGKPVFAKIGRFGPIVQLGVVNPEDTDAPKPQFASLVKGQSIDTITLEEALKLFELPRTVGEYKGSEMVASVGRFGPFIRYDKKFISIPKALNPLTISPEEAIALIEEKQRKDEQRFIRKFEGDPEIEILNGRFGPYITCKGKNYNIPRTMTVKPEDLTLEEITKIIEDADKNPSPARKRKPSKTSRTK